MIPGRKKNCESVEWLVFIAVTVVKGKISFSNYVQNYVLLYQNGSFHKLKPIYTKVKDYSRNARATSSVRSSVSLANFSFSLQ